MDYDPFEGVEQVLQFILGLIVVMMVLGVCLGMVGFFLWSINQPIPEWLRTSIGIACAPGILFGVILAGYGVFYGIFRVGVRTDKALNTWKDSIERKRQEREIWQNVPDGSLDKPSALEEWGSGLAVMKETKDAP